MLLVLVFLMSSLQVMAVAKATATSTVKKPSAKAHQTTATDTVSWSKVKGAQKYTVYRRKVTVIGNNTNCSAWKSVKTADAGTVKAVFKRTIPVYETVVYDGGKSYVQYSVVPALKKGAGSRMTTGKLSTTRYIRK